MVVCIRLCCRGRKAEAVAKWARRGLQLAASWLRSVPDRGFHTPAIYVTYTFGLIPTAFLYNSRITRFGLSELFFVYKLYACPICHATIWDLLYVWIVCLQQYPSCGHYSFLVYERCTLVRGDIFCLQDVDLSGRPYFNDSHVVRRACRRYKLSLSSP